MSESELLHDGSIRLRLNPAHLTKLTCIELPCFVRSTETALNMLGSKEQVASALLYEETPLHLQFPGEYPLRSVLTGTRTNRQGVLLKMVRRKRVPSSGEIQSNVVSLEAMGLVTKTTCFPNPADYQFLPTSVDHELYNPNCMESEGDEDVDLSLQRGTILETIPQSFCRVDDFEKRQQYLAFLTASKRKKRSTDMVKGDKQPGEASTEAAGDVSHSNYYNNLDNINDNNNDNNDDDENSIEQLKNRDRKVRNPDAGKTGEVIIKFGQPIPTKHPNGLYPSRWVAAARKGEERFRGMTFIDLLRRMFDAMPVLKRQQIVDIMGLGRRQHLFRECLPYAAYSYSSGPFSNLWIRYGYDPMAEPASRCYQLLNCRYAQPFLKEISDKIAMRLGKERTANRMVDLGKMTLRTAPEEFEHKFIDKGAFARMPVTMFSYVFKHQIAFQILTLAHRTVFDFVAKLPIATACAEQTGWFTDESATKFRHFMSQFMHSRAEEFAQQLVLLDEGEGEPVVELGSNPAMGVDLQELERKVQFFETLMERLNSAESVESDSLPPDLAANAPNMNAKNHEIAHMVYWMRKYQFSARTQTEMVSRIFVQRKAAPTKEWTKTNSNNQNTNINIAAGTSLEAVRSKKKFAPRSAPVAPSSPLSMPPPPPAANANAIPAPFPATQTMDNSSNMVARTIASTGKPLQVANAKGSATVRELLGGMRSHQHGVDSDSEPNG